MLKQKFFLKFFLFLPPQVSGMNTKEVERNKPKQEEIKEKFLFRFSRYGK